MITRCTVWEMRNGRRRNGNCFTAPAPSAWSPRGANTNGI